MIPATTFQAYGVAKAAQDKMTINLALEFARKGVRVNSVLPGGVLANFVPGIALWCTVFASKGVRSQLSAARWNFFFAFSLPGITLRCTVFLHRKNRVWQHLISLGYQVSSTLLLS